MEQQSLNVQLISKNTSVVVAFAFSRAVLAITILGIAVLRGFSTTSTENGFLLVAFVGVALLGIVIATRTLALHYQHRSVLMARPWALILLDSALAIGVMAMLDTEASPLAWVALIVPVIETALFFAMLPAVFVWVGLSIAFLALRLTLRLPDESGIQTLTLAIQQVFAVLLVGGPLALLTDGAQQRIDGLSEARRSADQSADQLRRIAQAASDMSKENSIESVLTSVSRSAVNIGFDHADVVVREADGSFTLLVSHSSGPFQLPPLEVLTRGANETNVTTIVASGDTFGQILHSHDLASGHAVQVSSDSAINQTSAVLRVWSKRRPSTENEIRALGLLAGHAREIHHAATLLAQAEAHADQLLHTVRHDALTGLANRSFILSTLEESLASQQQTALFFLDLDGFKAINDTLGHRAGDAALQTVADRLRSVCQQGSFVGRMGGDEFIIIVPITPLHTTAGLNSFGLAVLEAISRPMVVDGHNAQLGASIGLAVHANDVGADQLISLADKAMYEAKRTGGGLTVTGSSTGALSPLIRNAS